MRLLPVLLCAVAFSTSTLAQAPADAQLPPALRDWRAWTLKDLEYRACPFLGSSAATAPNEFICAWPARLNLSSNAHGATFAIRWRVEAPSWVPLPGEGQNWPQQVTVNGQRQPVLYRPSHRAPALWLVPGSYEIAGRIPWTEQPQSLAVPAQVGLVSLSVDGKPVTPVQRDGNWITLGRVNAAPPEADSTELRVYRKLADDVPATLATRVLLNVSGQAREEVFGPALPPGFEPTTLTSTWPARVDGEGKLHVQVQPGSETLELDARANVPLQDVVAKLGAEPWPKQEVWSYEASPRLRVTAASGQLQLDPRQAEVPAEWQSLPAFALGDGAKLMIEERSRGLAADEANRLNLQREAWLDFSGNGWYAHDRVNGNLLQGWRFDVAAPFSLEQATALNAQQAGGEPLLITRGANPGATGVEWRTSHVDLAAGLRIATPVAMPITGWQQTFDGVQATLHFPFGYKLLAAPGADSAGGSWISAWSLLDVFLCAIVVLLAWRSLGLLGAAAVVVYLLLGYQESGRPLWTLLATLAFVLIARAIPAGRLGSVALWLRRAALLLLVLWALPFVATQVRYALYPQLEEQGLAYRGVNRVPVNADGRGMAYNAPTDQVPQMQAEETEAASAPVAEAPPAPPAPRAPMPQKALKGEPKSAQGQALDTVVVTGSNIRRVDIETSSPVVDIDRAAVQKGYAQSKQKQIEHYSETTVIQTGGGAPDWTLGSTAWLSWSGPVLATQTVHLLIAPPWLVRPLRIVLAALLAWLIWQLFRNMPRPATPRGAIAAVSVLLLAVLGFGAPAHAQNYPPADLLAQLRARAMEAPKCAPVCASAAEAQVAANGDSVSVALEVHAGERIAVPLPNDAAGAAVKSIQVDGVAEEAVARNETGVLWLALGRGVHRVQIDYAASADKVALAFPLKPAHVLFQGKGWEASGLSEERLLTETLTLVRAHDSARGSPATGVQQFPPYVRVQRDLSLGLEWTVRTTVERIAPAQGGFTVDVPALPGEHVSSTGIKVENGKIPAALGEGDASSGWESTLDRGDTLALTAPALAERAEVWSIVVSPTWHVEFNGVPGVGPEQGENANEFRRFEFHPLPGETLSLHITRPAPAQGASRAIDAVSLITQAGQRASTHELAFRLRASQGGDQVVALPNDAEILGVVRDGQALNVRLLDGKLSLPIVPGTHNYDVRFRDASALGPHARTPELNLGTPVANLALTLKMPADRWLLATFGPPVGPAVLYWGELIVMIALAWALSRTRRTRLRFHHWFLLGIGFSTFSWSALLIVVAWLFAFDWRARGAGSPVYWRFNVMQIALVLLTIAALIALVSAIPQGLLGEPDMRVAGNGSSAQSLQWFSDHSAETLPQSSAISLPLWVYKVLMLAWALWLANALISWLRDGFTAWTRDGYWRAKPAVVPAAAATDVPAENA